MNTFFSLSFTLKKIGLLFLFIFPLFFISLFLIYSSPKCTLGNRLSNKKAELRELTKMDQSQRNNKAEL